MHFYNELTYLLTHSPTKLWLTDPQTQLPASSLDLSDQPSQTTSVSNQPFCHNAPDTAKITASHYAPYHRAGKW